MDFEAQREARRIALVEGITRAYPYYANMREIGRYVSHFGKPPEIYGGNMRTLKAGIYSADAFIGARSGKVTLTKHNPNGPGSTAVSHWPNLNLEINSNGHIEIFGFPTREPALRSFEMPLGRNAQHDLNPLFLQITCFANKVGTYTQEYLTNLTNNALEVFRQAYPTQPVQVNLESGEEVNLLS